VKSFYDSETSIVWANGLKQQLPTSILILRNGVGHTSYQTYGEISIAIDDYLLTGSLPAQGTVYDN